MSAHAPIGAMLTRKLSWTLRAPRASPASRRSAVAASRRAAPSSSAGGDEPPKAVKTKRRVVRRLADSDAGSVANPTPAAPAAAPKAAREKTAPGAASANEAAPKKIKPVPKKRTVRRLKDNPAPARARENAAAAAENARDDADDDADVSDERRSKEARAVYRFQMIAKRIAEEEEDAALDGASLRDKILDDSADNDPNDEKDTPLVPRDLSILEEATAARRAADAESRETRVRAPDAAKRPADETPGERLKRLFREKRERGLRRVRDKFDNQEMFDRLAGGGPSGIDSETRAESLERGEEIFGEAARANQQNREAFEEDETSGSILLRGGGNGLSPNNSIDPFKLIPGEYVVHRKFGIGKFLGIRSIAVEAPTDEDGKPVGPKPRVGYLFIEYADTTAKIKPEKARAQLYRFASPGAIQAGVKPPKLSRIQDRKGWEAKEESTKRHIRQLVVNQMCVYLQRLQCMRNPYQAPSSDVYERFGDLFPFELTPDQAMAVKDCYEDLSTRDTPMDRIVVGDVGFGKTEVAMRAIFRVFAGGGQVFVLAPTTVLAKQHAATIAARFRPFGASVELLSRHTKESGKKDVIERWKRGETQVLVGTHSLLNLAPEAYKRLNMLVIDEEQRFGVKHKDQISALKSSVDVLTLSATPIPRTLHMAIAGFRDASLVTTPPPQRRPINTVLQVYDAKMVHDAIQTELDRQGQIFYVVPKIAMMDDAMKRLRSLFPDIRIMEAHGQMRGDQLDAAMDEFSSGNAEILLCTTIVESGLDIPNVNTIIIEEVQQFGLASLYQLRGRVGRAGRQAHAYMFHADPSDLREDAQERLLALEECCGLGEGFKLAERDMAIRGVGTIFGDKQSGEVDTIGADLYLELLYNQLEKIEKLRINPISPKEVQTPDWSETPGLSKSYVATKDAREVADASLEGARSNREIDRVMKGLTQCFGEADKSSKYAVNYFRMRALASEVGVTRVSVDLEMGVVDFDVDADVEVREMLVENVDAIYKKDLRVTDTGIRVTCLAGAGMEVFVAQAVNALRRINEALPSFIKFL